MAMKLPDMGKQVGPLPLGAWVIVVGAGLGFAYYSRSSGDVGYAADPDGLEDTSIPPGVGVGTGSFIPALPVTTDPNNSDDFPLETDYGPVDNEEWVREAVTKMLVGSGYNPLELMNALTAYINAKPLTARQQAIVNMAVQTAGTPPFPLASTRQPRPPVPGAKPQPKPQPRTYKFTAKELATRRAANTSDRTLAEQRRWNRNHPLGALARRRAIRIRRRA